MRVIHLIARVSILSIFLAIGFNANSQPGQPVKDGERVLFVEIKDLADDSYADLTVALKDNPMFQIKQVCIPAGVLMLTIPATNTKSLEENFMQFADIAKNKAELDNAHVLAEYDESTFLSRCKQFRTGG